MSNRIKRRRPIIQSGLAVQLCNAGCHAFHAGDLVRAEGLFRAAVRLDPFQFEAWQNLGSTLIEAGRLDEGLECQSRAIILDPNRSSAHLAKAVAYRLQGRIDDALAACRDSLDRGAADDARLLYAHLLLMQGNFLYGWHLHEQARASGYNSDHVDRLWTAQDVRGKRVLLLGEQGFGDDLQFVRYAALVKERGATVIVGAKPALARIFESVPGVDDIAPFNQPPPEFDYFCPFMRLPFVFGTTIDTIPAEVPYLTPHPEDVAYWAQKLRREQPAEEHASRLTPHASLTVGLCWHGASRKHDPKANRVDRRRSMTLDDLAPLFSLPGISWCSLQVDEPDGDRLTDSPIHLFTDSPFVDFADTAAFIANLDLVVSVDTAVCHLAGALGKPVLMLSRFDGCWRWLLDRSDTPWYPSMTIFRQPRPGDWASVVEAVATRLRTIRDA